ncbi:MAG: hypothetical protein QGF00_14555 [Planctomycetota bacterium]|jgi:hypothetical protein|nr:hypothetical protein [Planctomycetota bacterium]
MPSIRIKGIVRIARTVKEQLEQGVPENRLEDFRRQVSDTLHQIESICASDGLTPDHLPAPSRRAYYGLKEIDFENLPSRPAPVKPETIKVRNGVHNLKVFHHCVNEYASLNAVDQAVDVIGPKLQHWTEQFESIFERRNAGPHNLEARTGRAYAFFKLLSTDERLRLHIETVHRYYLLTQDPSFSPKKREPFIELSYLSYLYMSEIRQGKRLYQIDVGFLGADDDVLRDLIRCIHHRDREVTRRINDYQIHESYKAITTELSMILDPPEGNAKGREYDMDEIFESVNNTFFNGNIERPRLRWSQRETFRKFGHYSFIKDEVMLSSTLDSPDVPRSVVEFVMYHELLHKKHGLRIVGGKRFAHTAAFKTDEKRFPNYREAEAVIGKLAEARRRAMF